MRTEIDKLQDKYEDLILDGKKDEARKVRRQVEELRDELSESTRPTPSRKLPQGGHRRDELQRSAGWLRGQAPR